jgi:hypothetical protein
MNVPLLHLVNTETTVRLIENNIVLVAKSPAVHDLTVCVSFRDPSQHFFDRIQQAVRTWLHVKVIRSCVL